MNVFGNTDQIEIGLARQYAKRLQAVGVSEMSTSELAIILNAIQKTSPLEIAQRDISSEVEAELAKRDRASKAKNWGIGIALGTFALAIYRTFFSD